MGKSICVIIDNVKFDSVAKCCKHYGIKHNTVYNKVRRGMNVTDAILDSIRPSYQVDGMGFNRIVDMAAYYNIPRSTLGYRLLRGWSISDAVHLPLNGRRSLKRYRIGDVYGTAKELSEKYNIPINKIYKLYGGKK